MLEDQGDLASLFCKERLVEHHQVEAHAEESVQMNAHLQIHSPLSRHCQQRL